MWNFHSVLLTHHGLLHGCNTAELHDFWAQNARGEAVDYEAVPDDPFRNLGWVFFLVPRNANE